MMYLKSIDELPAVNAGASHVGCQWKSNTGEYSMPVIVQFCNLGGSTWLVFPSYFTYDRKK